MPQNHKLTNPLLVAVWPGMGHVAISAGYYLMSKLGMHGLAEFSSRELFDLDHVEVKAGLIQNSRLPRSRLFVWIDPNKQRDIIVFIGEAQPPVGRSQFCRKLLEYARDLGTERVFTFAAMATQMHPEHDSRVFVAATDEATLAEFRTQEVELLEEGQISGLNGVLLGIAAEMGMTGGCLLGEMPHVFAQLPYPGGALAVLRTFCKMTKLDIDLGELVEQAQEMSKRLGEILGEVEEKIREQGQEEEEAPEFQSEPEEEIPRLRPADEAKIEQLFSRANEDRSRAYELKKELDRLKAFDLYEDRFLDLFKKR